MHIIGLSGSLRKASLNSGLLRAATKILPDNMTMETFTLHDIPLYNGDLEQDQFPEFVTALKEKIAQADGLLISSPEYNHSIPGVMKNALDWLTRPSGEALRVFNNKPVALMGASPSGFGTHNAQTAWLPIIRLLNIRPFFQSKLAIPQAHKVFDEQGNLNDEKTQEQLKSFLADFASFLGQS